MISTKELNNIEKDKIKAVVKIHMATFKGFFLTSLGPHFLEKMYLSYTEFNDSGVIVAVDGESVVGFLAYSGDMHGLYKYMIRKRLFYFGLYSFLAFIRKPSIMVRLLRAFRKPEEVAREENYIELSSIGVSPERKKEGIGSMLINELKSKTDFNKYEYINLETDAIDNEGANAFYKSNEFILTRTYSTSEGRAMNEYRFSNSH